MARDQPWVGWRNAIVSQFLLLVGVGLALRASITSGWPGFFRRWAQITGAAALVSAGSWLMLGPRFIWFGILHFIALALLIGRLLAPLGALNLLLGAACIAAAALFQDAAFNPTPANIIGFVTVKPSTADYVPLFLSLGVVLIGVGVGELWRRRRFPIPRLLAALNVRPPRLLVWLGVWSLTVQLLPLLSKICWGRRIWQRAPPLEALVAPQRPLRSGFGRADGLGQHLRGAGATLCRPDCALCQAKP